MTHRPRGSASARRGAGFGQGGVELAQVALEVTFDLPNSPRRTSPRPTASASSSPPRAGYDPRAAVTLWQKMAGGQQGAPPQWLSTHPSSEARQRDLADYAEKVMPLYQARR